MQRAIKLSDQAANRLYSEQRVPSGSFESFTLDVQREICAAHPSWDDDSDRARFKAVRAGWRAALAPIIYSAEVKLAQNVQRRLAEGRSLAPLTAQRMPQFDTLLKMYGTFDGRRLAFLRAMSVLSRSAMNRTVLEIKHDPHHRLSEAARMFAQAEAEIAPFFRRNNEYPQLKDPLERPRQHAVTANVTALNILGPAALHSSVWPEAQATSTRDVMLGCLEELERPQYTTASLHAKHLPNYNNTYREPPGVFSTTGEQAAKSGIWILSALRKTWSSKQWCPAAIHFEDDAGSLLESAATMRLRTAIYVADGILWEASPDAKAVPVDESVRMNL